MEDKAEYKSIEIKPLEHVDPHVLHEAWYRHSVLSLLADIANEVRALSRALDKGAEERQERWAKQEVEQQPPTLTKPAIMEHPQALEIAREAFKKASAAGHDDALKQMVKALNRASLKECTADELLTLADQAGAL